MKVVIPINEAVNISYTLNEVLSLPDIYREDNGITMSENVVMYLLFKINHGEVPDYAFFTGAPHILGKIVQITTNTSKRYILVQLMTQGASYLERHLEEIERRMKKHPAIIRYRSVSNKTLRLETPYNLDVIHLIREMQERHPNY